MNRLIFYVSISIEKALIFVFNLVIRSNSFMINANRKRISIKIPKTNCIKAI